MRKSLNQKLLNQSYTVYAYVVLNSTTLREKWRCEIVKYKLFDFTTIEYKITAKYFINYNNTEIKNPSPPPINKIIKFNLIFFYVILRIVSWNITMLSISTIKRWQRCSSILFTIKIIEKWQMIQTKTVLHKHCLYMIN